MTPSQKNEKALAALREIASAPRMSTSFDRLQGIADEAIATLSEPETVGGEVVTVPTFEDLQSTGRFGSVEWLSGYLGLDEDNSAFLEGWINSERRKIHALIQSRVGGR